MKHVYPYLSIFIFSFVISTSTAQQSTVSQAKAVNNYVVFANESDHGLLIIHRLLELYNQEMNKYVDLPQYKLNLFSNDDFPENIFEDQSGSFYRVSPNDLYVTALKESSSLPPKYAGQANDIIKGMKSILDDLEKERYSIGTLIANTDLTQRTNLKNIYAALDACVVKYDAYEGKRKELENLVNKISPEARRNDAFNKSFVQVYKAYCKDLHALFNALRLENVANAIKADLTLMKSAQTLANALNATDASKLTKPQATVLEELRSVLKKQMGHLEAFSGSQSVPKEYEQYGICYYMYNILLAGTTNKYGTGVVERGNEWIKVNGGNYAYGFERPHFYKVIRPKQVIEEEKNAEPIVAPVVEDNRKIVVDKEKAISSNVEKLLIEVYDNQEFDHDTISLKFNGEWILKKQLITKEPIRLYLPLEKGKDNYLILYADNLGTIPPNTCAIRWTNDKGKYNEIVLKSDFNTSEMVIIRRQ